MGKFLAWWHAPVIERAPYRFVFKLYSLYHIEQMRNRAANRRKS